MSQDRLFIWKGHWKQFGWICKLGGVGSQGIPGLARLIEIQIRCPSAGPVRGGLGRREMVSASSFIWEKAIPPVLALMLGNSVLPCMSLLLFELLPHH